MANITVSKKIKHDIPPKLQLATATFPDEVLFLTFLTISWQIILSYRTWFSMR
jgi:hypothetical protein